METTKVTFNLPTEVVDELKAMAAASGSTVTEALRRSIVTSKFLHDQEAQNAQILIKDADGRMARLVRK